MIADYLHFYEKFWLIGTRLKRPLPVLVWGGLLLSTTNISTNKRTAPNKTFLTVTADEVEVVASSSSHGSHMAKGQGSSAGCS